MDGIRRLPKELYSLLIDKYFDQSSCVTLALSGGFHGFSPMYTSSRKYKGLVINEKCFFLTPASYSTFIDQHISLDSITVFNINQCYWLPAELLQNTITKMPKLEELSIKGTKLCTVCQLAKILQACPKVVKVDFFYTEKTQEEIWDGMEKDGLSSDSLAASFSRFKTLKMSTTALGAQNNCINDPWLLIIKMLTTCRDCTELSIEITYSGKRESLSDDEDDVDLRERNWHYRYAGDVQAERRDLFPHIEWMKALKSLVLIKLGSFASEGAGRRVISILLDAFFAYLFPGRQSYPILRPLRCLWIQDFEILPLKAFKYLSSDCLVSYRSGEPSGSDKENYERFHNMEHLGGTIGLDFSRPLPTLSKLKYASGSAYSNKELYEFCESHPALEQLSVQFELFLRNVPDDTVCQLPKLKSFSCQRGAISKGFIEAMTEAYQNLETLKLSTYRLRTSLPDDRALSALSFPKLTSLSLKGFDLRDGAALVEIIEQCPKLEVLHLETDSLEASSFLSNLKRFLGLAVKLRDFRFKWNHEEEGYPAFALLLLKEIQKSVLLERLTLIDGGSDKLPFWINPPGFADALVEFTTKMTHMSSCCLTFNQLDCFLIVDVKKRIAEEFVSIRPSLWFYLDRGLPDVTDQNVPAVHYYEMVNPKSFEMPTL